MLSQAAYWHNRCEDWFFKTAAEWTEETGLTVEEQKGARKRLKEKGFISEKLSRVPPVVHFRVEVPAILSALGLQLGEIPQIDSGEMSKLITGNSPNPIRKAETTTETTTKPSRSKKPERERGELKTRIETFVKATIVKRANLPAAPWDGGAAKQLNNLVDKNPSWSDDDFERLLRNWSKSDPEIVRFGDHPKVLFPRLSRFAGGPIMKLTNGKAPPKNETTPFAEAYRDMYGK